MQAFHGLGVARGLTTWQQTHRCRVDFTCNKCQEKMRPVKVDKLTKSSSHPKAIKNGNGRGLYGDQTFIPLKED